MKKLALSIILILSVIVIFAGGTTNQVLSRDSMSTWIGSSGNLVNSADVLTAIQNNTQYISSVGNISATNGALIVNGDVGVTGSGIIAGDFEVQGNLTADTLTVTQIINEQVVTSFTSINSQTVNLTASAITSTSIHSDTINLNGEDLQNLLNLKQTAFVGLCEKCPVNVSIDYDTKVLTVTAVTGSSFDIFTDGSGVVERHTITSPCNFPAYTSSSGVWYFYIDNTGTPVTTQTAWSDFSLLAPIYRIYVNANLTGSAMVVVESLETHMNTMSSSDHAWKHKYGTIWLSGFDLISNVTNGTPDTSGLNTAISLKTGKNMDDNLSYTVTNSTSGALFTQDLGYITASGITVTNSAVMKIRGNDVNGILEMYPATRFPFLFDSGTNIPQYILTTGMAVDVPDNNYFVYYIYSLQDQRAGEALKTCSAIETFSTLLDAQASDWIDLQNVYPTLKDEEIRPLYKLIFQYKSTYSSNVKYTALRETVDLRRSNFSVTNNNFSITATNVSSTTFGTISSTNLQSAIEELSSEKIDNSGVAGGQTIIGGTATTERLILRGNSADTTSGGITVLSSLQSTAHTNGSLIVSGGVGIAKNINTAGTLTAVSTISKLRPPAGTSTADTAPLKLIDGTLNTDSEVGAIEFSGDSLYFTNVSEGRKEVGLYNTHYGEMYAFENANIIDIKVVNEYQAVTGSGITTGSCIDFTFKQGVTGSIASVSTYGAVVAGTSLFTVTAGHNLTTGDAITIHSTTNYDGTYTVTVVSPTAFYISKTFVATRTGSYYRGAYLEVGSSGAGTYKVNGTLTLYCDTNTTQFKVGVFKNTTEQTNIVASKYFTTANQYDSLVFGGILSLTVGDRLWLGIINQTDTTDVTIRHFNLSVNRI